MIDNTLYYTFSTIAQTLAAAFGVLTAIVVIRLPALEAAPRHGNEATIFR